MAANTVAAPVTFYPKVSDDIPWETRKHLQLIYQKLNNHALAFANIASAVKGTNTTTIEEVASGGGGGSTNIGLTVNDQAGSVAYTTGPGDNGTFLILNDASAIAVTLGTGVPIPWSFFIANQGVGTATFTPASGTISYAGNPGAASFPLLGGYCCLIAFDGTDFWAWTEPLVPANTPAVAGEFLAAYNSATGLFTQTTLPVATPSSLGVVEPDNSTITISAGVITAVGGGGGGITQLTGDVTAGPGAGSQVATVVKIPPGVTLTGTPSAGQVPTATGSTTATWQTISGAINFSDAEIPSGAINGTNTTFTLAHTPSPAASVIASLAGLVQWQNVSGDYTLSGTTMTFTSAPTVGPLIVWYRF